MSDFKKTVKFLTIILLLLCVMPIGAQQKEIVTYKGKLNDGREWSSFVPKRISKKDYNAFGISVGDQRVIFDKNKIAYFMGMDYHWKLVASTIDSYYVGEEPYFIVKVILKDKKRHRRVAGIYDITGKQLYYSSDSKEAKDLKWRIEISNYTIGRAKFLFIQDDLSSNHQKYYSYDWEYIGTQIEENHIYESPQIKFLKVYSGSDTYYGFMTYDGKWLAKPENRSISENGNNHLVVKKFHGNGKYYFENQKVVSLQQPQCVGICFSWMDIETGDTIISEKLNCVGVNKYNNRDDLFVISTIDGKYGILNRDGKIIVKPISKKDFNNPNILRVYETSKGIRIFFIGIDHTPKLMDEQGHILHLNNRNLRYVKVGKYEYFIGENGLYDVYYEILDIDGNLLKSVTGHVDVIKTKRKEYISVGSMFSGMTLLNPDCTPATDLPTDRAIFKLSERYVRDFKDTTHIPTYYSDGTIIMDENLNEIFSVGQYKVRDNSLMCYNGKAYFRILNGILLGLYDDKGNEIIAPKYYFIEPFCEYNGTNYFQTISSQEATTDALLPSFGVFDALYGISSAEKEILPTKFDEIEKIGENLLKCTKKGKIGIYNFLGQEKLKPEYDKIRVWDEFNRNLLFIHKKDNSLYKFGMASSTTGDLIIPAIYDDLWYIKGINSYVRFKQNGYWGVMNLQGKVIIPTSRCYSDISYDSSKNVFAFKQDGGIKGECNIAGKQISLTKPTAQRNIASNSGSSPHSTNANQSVPPGLLYKGLYTSGDGVDTQTGMVMAGVNITQEIEIYEDHLQVGYIYAEYKRTNNNGTRVYGCSSDGFGNPMTFYVTSSFEITQVVDYYSYGFHNQVRTPYTKGQVTYSPTMNGNYGNYGNSYDSSPNQTQSTDSYNSNPGLSAAQYQEIYNGYEKIVEGILSALQRSPDMNYGPRTQNLQVLRDTQNSMQRIRQEAASHGITISQSYYETARP